MKLCPACDRHLFGVEPICPFCGAEQATVAARTEGGVLASVAMALTLGATACGPQVVLEEMDESTTVEDTGLPPSVTTTTSVTTVGPMTDDGPAMTTIDTTSGSGSSDDEDDAPCAFYACRPDGGGSSIECDVFAQDCPIGEKCVPWSDDDTDWNATRCVPIAPDPVGAGEPCTVEGSGTSGLDDCDLGSMCWHVDPKTLMGTCVSLCGGTERAPTCPEEGQACSISNNGVLTLCLPACNPLLGDCPEGDGCYPVEEVFICQWTAYDAVYGEPCEYINACAAGHMCVGSPAFPDCAGNGCCTVYCDVSMGLPCPQADQGMICQAWYEDGMAPPGYENVGGCALPP